MRVAVINSQTPFMSGRAERLADDLCEALARHGHSTELVRIPFACTPVEAVVDQMLAVRLVRLDNTDRAIALSFPSYFVPHDDKVVWLQRQFRPAYEPDGAADAGRSRTPAARNVCSAVREADRSYLGEATRLHTDSAARSDRLRRDLGLSSELLYAPLCDPDVYRCDEYGDYMLALGPIAADGPGRLAVAAIGRTGSAMRLLIIGSPGGRDDLSALRQLAREGALEDRIELIRAPIDDAERVRLLAGARAVLCIDDPDEPCGQHILAAFQSHKPAVVLQSEHAAVDLVRDGVSGRVAASSAELADAIDELAEDAGLAERYGDAGFRQLQTAEISWETVVRELTR